MTGKAASMLLLATIGAGCASRHVPALPREQPSAESCAEANEVAAARAELRRVFLGLEAPPPTASNVSRGVNIDMELQLRLNPGKAGVAPGSPGLSMARAVDNAGRTVLPYERATWNREAIGQQLQRMERRAAELPTPASCEGAGLGGSK